MKDEKTQVRLNLPLVAILVVLALVAAAGVLYWNDVRNDAQRISQATAKSHPGEAELRRTVNGAGIEAAATFMNPLMPPEEAGDWLVFKVALNTHVGDLMGLDLTRLATLSTDDGKAITEGFTWEPLSESSHHRMGLLRIPATAQGAPVIGPETQAIELELKEIGIPSRVFRWERADWP